MDKVLVPVVIFALVFVTQFVFASRYDWQCGNCGHTFSLSPLSAMLMPHRFGGQKLVKCPDCGVRSWASPVRKQ